MICYFNPPTFGTFFIQVAAPFETIRYFGFEWCNNCVQCWFPKWFWMVGQLIQNLVWILTNGRSANTKPCLDTSKWWINGPSKTIWMVVQLATNTVQMVSPCVYKTNGHFWKWKYWMVSNGLSVGGLNCHKQMGDTSLRCKRYGLCTNMQTAIHSSFHYIIWLCSPDR